MITSLCHSGVVSTLGKPRILVSTDNNTNKSIAATENGAATVTIYIDSMSSGDSIRVVYDGITVQSPLKETSFIQDADECFARL